MSRFSLPLAVVAVAFFFTTGAAQSTTQDHSWVSSTGTGSACTRTAPCNSFTSAQTATSPGGIISVLDSADYGTTIITKALTIRAEGVDAGGTLSFLSQGGTWITVAAGPFDVVTLEGLRFNGANIRLNTGAHLHIVRCVITNDTTADDAGIKFQPSIPSKLSVTDTVISNFGSGTGGGIVVKPQAGGSAQVNLERVTINGNAFGIAADGTGSSAGINMTIADSMIGGNAQDGIIAVTPSGGAPIGVMVKNSKSVNNAIGIRSIGPSVTVRVSNSSVIGNSTGLSFSGGAALLSFGNNEVAANAANGAFSGTVGLQ